MPTYDKGDTIEVEQIEEGLTGARLVAVVKEVVGDKIRVQYQEFQDDEGNPLEEDVLESQIYKPACGKLDAAALTVGNAVCVYANNAWWPALITRKFDDAVETETVLYSNEELVVSTQELRPFNAKVTCVPRIVLASRTHASVSFLSGNGRLRCQHARPRQAGVGKPERCTLRSDCFVCG